MAWDGIIKSINVEDQAAPVVSNAIAPVAATAPKLAYTPTTVPTRSSPNQTVQTINYTMPAQQFSYQNFSTPAPTYQGLMDGDYDKLQSALAVGGNQAAQNAWNAGTQNLANSMSGRGLYGSSIMQNQQTQGLDREYMKALAANEAQAAATRYGLQQSDLQKAAEMQLAGWQGLLGENTAKNQIYGTLANTALQGQNSLATQTLQNSGQLDVTRLQGQNTLANTGLQNSGQLANTTLQGQNAMGLQGLQNAGQLANTGLLGQNAISERNLINDAAWKTAQLNDANSRYATDKNYEAALNRDKTSLAQTNIQAGLASDQLRAQIAAAAKAGDNQLLSSLLGIAGAIYGKNFDDVNSLLGDGLVAAGDGIRTLWDSLFGD